MSSDEAQSAAFAGIWDDRDVPAPLKEWIADRVRRILQNQAQRRRRQGGKQPLLSDITSRSNGVLEKPDYQISDHRESRPDVEAANREELAHLMGLPRSELETKTLDHLLGRPDAPKNKHEIVLAARCSAGHAYRRIARFEERIVQYFA
jgi:hypothetical protein